MDEWSFDLGELGAEVANLPNLAGYDVALDDGFSFDIGNIASELQNLGGLDLGGFNAALDDGYSFDISSLANELANIDGLANFGVADDLFGVNPDVVLQDYGFGGYDLGGYDSLPELTRSLYSEEGALTPKRVNMLAPETYRIPTPAGGEGLRMPLDYVGRGQVALPDMETGATGLIGEGFQNVKDLLGSGTREEIARYTPGTADYALRSGLETEGGLGMTADATRGMGLTSMGGAQGLSQYIPAEYSRSVLEDLVRGSKPGEYPLLEEYINKELYGPQGLKPYSGTGGTLTSSGFLAQSSAANPLGAKYALGDPNSFINKLTTTGQQGSVSPGRTVINKGDGTYKIITETKDGAPDTKIVDEKGLPVRPGTPGLPGQQPKDLLSSLLPLLLMLMAMNRGGGSSGASNAVIPALTATQKQTPYTQIQQAPGYRPGQGGITYFDPVQYAPRMAGGGIIDLAKALAAKRREQRQGLLKGRGDGTSDSIPAMIGQDQPARLARGEYVVDARTVAELGNGSTDAGAERLDEMRKRVHAKRKKAKVGEDSKASKELPA